MATMLTKRDALQSRYKSTITVFVPKLSPKYLKPHCMVNVANGNGSTLIRFESPEKVAEFFRGLADRITTLDWIDKWQCLEDISSKIVSSGIMILDEDFVDVDLFEEKINADLDQEEKAKEPMIATKKGK